MANLKTAEKKTKAQSMGMHTEVLTGKTQQKFFNPDEAENFFYWGTYDVDFNKRTELDVKDMECKTHLKNLTECSPIWLRQKTLWVWQKIQWQLNQWFYMSQKI